MSKIVIGPKDRERSFEDVYTAEFPSVFRAVYLATGDREAALDATQEAFKRAYVRWPRLSREEWVGGWVMTTALNVARRHKRRESRGDHDDSIIHDERDASERIDVVTALRRLPQRQRIATVLYYFGDLPIPLVAEFMRISEGGVKAHLAQARARLRRLLEVADA